MTNQLQKLGDLASGRAQLSIPAFQRLYSWQSKNYNELLDDYINSCNKDPQMDRDAKSYFIGTIVLSNGKIPGQRYVIDGQQRLVTTSLIMAAISYVLRVENKSPEKSRLADNFFCYDQQEEYGQPIWAPRISSNSTIGADATIFNRFLCDPKYDGELLDPKAKSHRGVAYQPGDKLMVTAFNSFVKSLSNTATFEDNPDLSDLEHNEALIRLVKHINNSEFLLLEAPNEREGYKLFDLLNTKGLRLGPTDIIKSYILQRFYLGDSDQKNSFNLILSQWQHCEQVAGDNFDQYYRQYWNSKYTKSAKNSLFSNFRHEFEDQPLSEIASFVDGLVRACDTLVLFYNVDKIPSGVDQSVRDSLEAIFRHMKFKQAATVLLPVFEGYFDSSSTQQKLKSKFSNKEARRVLEIIENAVLYTIKVDEQRANKFETTLNKWAIRFRDVTTKTEAAELVNDFHRGMHELMDPDFGTFQAFFAEREYTNKNRGKLSSKNDNLSPHLLKKLYRAFTGIPKKYGLKDYLEILTKDSSSKMHNLQQMRKVSLKDAAPGSNFTIEHLIPDSEQDHTVRKLGNLVYMEKLKNEEMGNRPMEDKLEMLRSSSSRGVELLLRDYPRFDKDNILERTDDLARLYYEVFVLRCSC